MTGNALTASSVPSLTSVGGSNSHIFAYLDEYIELKQPNYAVMLNGAWGIGKSHAVGSYIADLRKQSKTVAAVSLYGVRTADEIDTLLLTSAHALLDNAVAKYGISIGKAFFKKVSFGTDAKVADLLPKSKIDLFVFDDLERASMQPSEVAPQFRTVG
jgi:hypothetical protein